MSVMPTLYFVKLNVKSVFLHGFIIEEMYDEQPTVFKKK